MDDSEKMDLALTSDFDSSLLNCWENKNEEAKLSNNNNGGSLSPRSNHSSIGDGGGGGGRGGMTMNWDGSSSPHFSQLPSFATEEDTTTAGNNGKSNNGGHRSNSNGSNNNNSNNNGHGSQQQRKHSPVPVSTHGSVTSGATSRTSKSRSSSQNQQQQQQQQSSSSNNNNNNNNSSNNGTATQMHPLAIPSSANCPPHIMQSGMQNAFFPMIMSSLQGNAAAAAFAAGLSLQTAQPQHQQLNNNNSNNNASFFQSMPCHLNGNGNAAVNNASSQQQNHHQQQQTNNSAAGHHQQQQQSQQQRPNAAAADNNNNNSNNAATRSSEPPAFYLFDAPCELRQHFHQAQRMHGLPVLEDNNSYHYGVSVNGFHPQNLNNNNASSSSLSPLTSSNGGGASASGSQASSGSNNIKLIDARHGNRKSGRIKNEREQRRAQKITELIEQLREKMESGGWKVEMKSKFHTLSSCADYVKHLIETTKEKEDAVNKARNDLQMKERKAEDDKSLQEPRSDPESVMSSLTSGSNTTTGATNKVSQSSEEVSGRKRKSASSGDGEGASKKKSRHTSDSGSSDSSGGEDRACQRSSGNQTSLSDMTDSNKGSSKSGSETQKQDDDDASGTPSSISAASSAAVVKGRDRNNSHTKHADVVIKGRHVERKHKTSIPTEITSLEESFVLDYEEVFLKSNVPQVIATTAGRIVAWNQFFLKATGMTKSAAKGLTIFSLVDQKHLAQLFSIVSSALRDAPPTPPAKGKDAKEDDGKDSLAKWEYTGMTLPCIEFPSAKERRSKGGEALNPLYITVTLMFDEDRTKRLFHCVFTDSPGTNGALGSITPELLATFFSTNHHRSKHDAEKVLLEGH